DHHGVIRSGEVGLPHAWETPPALVIFLMYLVPALWFVAGAIAAVLEYLLTGSKDIEGAWAAFGGAFLIAAWNVPPTLCSTGLIAVGYFSGWIGDWSSA